MKAFIESNSGSEEITEDNIDQLVYPKDAFS